MANGFPGGAAAPRMSACRHRHARLVSVHAVQLIAETVYQFKHYVNRFSE